MQSDCRQSVSTGCHNGNIPSSNTYCSLLYISDINVFLKVIVWSGVVHNSYHSSINKVYTTTVQLVVLLALIVLQENT